MSLVAKELLTVDRQRLDLRAGVLGVVVLSVFALCLALFGTPAMAAVIGALVVVSTDPPVGSRARARALLPLVVGGAALTFVAVWLGDRAVPAALLVGLVAVVASLHAGRSRKAGVRGLVATIWVILALTLQGTGARPLEYAVAFAIGAVAGAAAAWVRAGSAEGTGEDDVEDEGAGGEGLEGPASPPARSFATPLARFAALRGVGLAVAVLLGFTWFPAHPAWIAITAVVVMRPPTRRALVVGVQRSLGTGVGVILAVALAEVIGDNTPGLVVLFLASAFLMMAVREANYALFAMLVTAVVVYAQRILGADAAESGRDRFLETVIGVAIAFAVLGSTEALDRGRSATD